MLRPLEVIDDAQSYMRFLKASMLTLLRSIEVIKEGVCSSFQPLFRLHENIIAIKFPYMMLRA